MKIDIVPSIWLFVDVKWHVYFLSCQVQFNDQCAKVCEILWLCSAWHSHKCNSSQLMVHLWRLKVIDNIFSFFRESAIVTVKYNSNGHLAIRNNCYVTGIVSYSITHHGNRKWEKDIILCKYRILADLNTRLIRSSNLTHILVLLIWPYPVLEWKYDRSFNLQQIVADVSHIQDTAL